MVETQRSQEEAVRDARRERESEHIRCERDSCHRASRVNCPIWL